MFLLYIVHVLYHFCFISFMFLLYIRGLQTTARGPDAARETISSGRRSHFVNNEKIICSTYEKFVNLVEYNISCKNHIA